MPCYVRSDAGSRGRVSVVSLGCRRKSRDAYPDGTGLVDRHAEKSVVPDPNEGFDNPDLGGAALRRFSGFLRSLNPDFGDGMVRPPYPQYFRAKLARTITATVDSCVGCQFGPFRRERGSQEQRRGRDGRSRHASSRQMARATIARDSAGVRALLAEADVLAIRVDPVVEFEGTSGSKSLDRSLQRVLRRRSPRRNDGSGRSAPDVELPAARRVLVCRGGSSRS